MTTLTDREPTMAGPPRTAGFEGRSEGRGLLSFDAQPSQLVGGSVGFGAAELCVLLGSRGGLPGTGELVGDIAGAHADSRSWARTLTRS